MSAIGSTIGKIGGMVLPHLPEIGNAVGGIVSGISNMFRGRRKKPPEAIGGPVRSTMPVRDIDLGGIANTVDKIKPGLGTTMYQGGYDMYSRGQDMYNVGKDLYNQGRGMFGSGMDTINQTRDLWRQGNIGGALQRVGEGVNDLFNRGASMYRGAQDMYGRGRDIYGRGRDLFQRLRGQFRTY